MNIKPKTLASIAFLFLALFTAAVTSAHAQSKSVNPGATSELIGGQSMEGSWTALVTIRDCTTGTALMTFPAMQTYAQGGTMQDSSADSRRSAGHGVWRHIIANKFAASFQFFNFDATGAPQGTTRVSLINTVDRTGDSFATDATVKIYNLMGLEVASACATSVAERFAPEID